MNLIPRFLAIILFACAISPALAQVSNTNVPAINHPINFRSVSVSQILQIYRNVTHLQLAVAPDVLQEKRTITLAATAHSSAEVAKFLEEALLKQTGIAITHIDDHHASAAYRNNLSGSK
jgi:hypothetical protein